MVIVWGIMGIFTPVSGTSGEEDSYPLFEGFSDERIGTISIDRAGSRYTIVANVSEQNGTLYYEILAHHPSGVPSSITWGMLQANRNGNLRCNDTFDSETSAWIQAWGRHGTIYCVRPLKHV